MALEKTTRCVDEVLSLAKIVWGDLASAKIYLNPFDSLSGCSAHDSLLIGEQTCG